jgi:acyl-CoA reductase-like NAD-dependent aldehyde dehydrogenase
VYREEMFAPVFSVLTFTDYEKAIHYANDHECAFASSARRSGCARTMIDCR